MEEPSPPWAPEEPDDDQECVNVILAGEDAGRYRNSYCDLQGHDHMGPYAAVCERGNTDESNITMIVAATVLPAAIIIAGILGVLLWRRNNRNSNSQSSNEGRGTNQSERMEANPGNNSDQDYWEVAALDR